MFQPIQPFAAVYLYIYTDFAIRYAQLIEQYHLCSRTYGVLWSICART